MKIVVTLQTKLIGFDRLTTNGRGCAQGGNVNECFGVDLFLAAYRIWFRRAIATTPNPNKQTNKTTWHE